MKLRSGTGVPLVAPGGFSMAVKATRETIVRSQARLELCVENIMTVLLKHSVIRIYDRSGACRFESMDAPRISWLWWRTWKVQEEDIAASIY